MKTVESRTLQAALSGAAPSDSWPLFAAAGLMDRHASETLVSVAHQGVEHDDMNVLVLGATPFSVLGCHAYADDTNSTR